MNRWDEIKGAALDVAQHVTQDPAKRDAMADDLITLVGLMVAAVGKVVSAEGEVTVNGVDEWMAPWDDGSCDPTPERAAEFQAEKREEEARGHVQYLVGESIQRAAGETANEGRAADLARWADVYRNHGKSGSRHGWHPRCVECGLRDGCPDDCAGRWNSSLPVHPTRSECVALPNGQGPSCDWDPDCPDHGDNFGLPAKTGRCDYMVQGVVRQARCDQNAGHSGRHTG